MATEPCAVCEFPVEIEKAKKETWINSAKIAEGVFKRATIAICGSPRCQRLLRKVLAEEGRRQVLEG